MTAITAAVTSRNKMQHMQPQMLRLPDREACCVAGLVLAGASTSGRAIWGVQGGAAGALIAVNGMSTAPCRRASLDLTFTACNRAWGYGSHRNSTPGVEVENAYADLANLPMGHPATIDPVQRTRQGRTPTTSLSCGSVLLPDFGCCAALCCLGEALRLCATQHSTSASLASP